MCLYCETPTNPLSLRWPISTGPDEYFELQLHEGSKIKPASGGLSIGIKSADFKYSIPSEKHKQV